MLTLLAVALSSGSLVLRPMLSHYSEVGDANYWGILLDLFEGNIGLNSSSLVFVSFLTPYLQRAIIAKNSIDEKDRLSLQILGFKTFSIYALSIILIHHSFLFLLDHFCIDGSVRLC